MVARNPPSPSRPPAGPSKHDPYHELEPIPQPEVEERSTDTVWALWSEVRESEQKRYEDTVPLTVPGAKGPAVPLRPAEPPAATNALDKLTDECKRNNRVCPKPGHWQQLDLLLRAKAPAAAARLPKPVPPRELDMMTALARRSMFRGVIEWAAANGATEDMLAFVRALPETEWHHLGE